jgi:hypothetical protein
VQNQMLIQKRNLLCRLLKLDDVHEWMMMKISTDESQWLSSSCNKRLHLV